MDEYLGWLESEIQEAKKQIETARVLLEITFTQLNNLQTSAKRQREVIELNRTENEHYMANFGR